MEEQAQQILIDLVQRAVDGVDKAVEFSQSQLPDVINQLLTWELLSSLIYNIPSFVIILLTIVLLFFAYRPGGWYKQVKDKDDVVFCTVLGVPTAILVSWIFCNFTWLKILVAPKLFLIQYAADLVK